MDISSDSICTMTIHSLIDSNLPYGKKKYPFPPPPAPQKKIGWRDFLFLVWKETMKERKKERKDTKLFFHHGTTYREDDEHHKALIYLSLSLSLSIYLFSYLSISLSLYTLSPYLPIFLYTTLHSSKAFEIPIYAYARAYAHAHASAYLL